jgi:hypothetical protein
VSKEKRAIINEEKSIQVGILVGFGWTSEEIAQHTGVTRSAISGQKQNHRRLIDAVAAMTKVGVERLVATRIREAEMKFEEMKADLHKKGYRVMGKTLDHAMNLPDEISPDTTHLRAAEMAIERTEGKPLDRKAILTRNENVEIRQIDGGDLDAILGEMALINEMRKSALQITDGKVKEAELV